MDVFDESLIKVWTTLSKYEVKYLMVGGFAVNLHGFHRYTQDMDIWIEDTLINRQRLRSAFRELDLGDISTLETMTFLAGWTDFKLDSDLILDIMTDIPGLENLSFLQCYDKASKAEILDLKIPFLNLNHLIVAKRTSNRPKDQIDLVELENILKINSSQHP